MSKLGCKCGHVIRDQTDDLAYKGTLIPDQEIFTFLNDSAERVAGFVKALLDGRREEWCGSYYRGFSDEDIILAVFRMEYFKRMRDVYQCENCGRLWLQVPGRKGFLSFSPDDPDWQDTLKTGSPHERSLRDPGNSPEPS